MKNLLIALIIGISAGIIDVVPMIIQRLDRTACISAFIQWLVLGLIIPFVSWEIQPWLKGLIIGELMALPIMVIVFTSDFKSILPIALMSAILGTAVGFAGAKFIQ